MHTSISTPTKIRLQPDRTSPPSAWRRQQSATYRALFLGIELDDGYCGSDSGVRDPDEIRGELQYCIPLIMFQVVVDVPCAVSALMM